MTAKNSKTLRAAAVAGAFALVLAGCSNSSGEDESTASGASPKDGVFKVGTVLPQTGSLAFLGPPEFAGVNLAVQDINDAGGVLGQEAEFFEGDSGDSSTNIASTTADQMISRGSDIIIGAASSSVSLSIIDKIASAGVVQLSPANTSTELTDYDDKGFYWRTAPPDLFQGQVMAEIVAGEGKTKPAVMVLQDSYGESLADSFKANFENAGGTLAGDPIYYDPKAATFDAEVGQAKATSPDSILLIGFEESKKIIQEMIKQGIGPDNVPLFLVDGNMSNTLAKGLPQGIMEGVIGTIPGDKDREGFQKQLLGVDPDLTDFSYANEAYDAVVVSALAAIAANSDSGPDIITKLVEVSAEGKKCGSFDECAKLLADGEDIDYEGRSGPIDFGDNGDPTRAVMGVYQFGADNTYTPKDFVKGDVPTELPGDPDASAEPSAS